MVFDANLAFDSSIAFDPGLTYALRVSKKVYRVPAKQRAAICVPMPSCNLADCEPAVADDYDDGFCSTHLSSDTTVFTCPTPDLRCVPVWFIQFLIDTYSPNCAAILAFEEIFGNPCDAITADGFTIISPCCFLPCLRALIDRKSADECINIDALTSTDDYPACAIPGIPALVMIDVPAIQWLLTQWGHAVGFGLHLRRCYGRPLTGLFFPQMNHVRVHYKVVRTRGSLVSESCDTIDLGIECPSCLLSP